MPYIEKKQRPEVVEKGATDAGELNYLLTYHILRYLNSMGLCYQTINDIVGALKCCSDEFYRRIVVPYEDKKIEMNGDVYEKNQ